MADTGASSAGLSGVLGTGSQSVSTATGSAFTLAQFNNLATITLGAGTWLLTGTVKQAYVALLTRGDYALSANSGNTVTDHVDGQNQVSSAIGVTGGSDGLANISWVVTPATNTTYYLKVKPTGATGNIFTGSITALKVG